MTSFSRSLLFAFALSASACNVDPDLAAMESGMDMAYQEQANTEPLPVSCPSTLPPAPPKPTAPTPLSRIPLGTPMFPTGAGVRSAYTVFVADPANPTTAFHAYGFDVRAQRLQFWVSGQNTRELRRLMSQLVADIDALEMDSGTDPGVTWGMSGQIGGPISPQPGVYEMSWRMFVMGDYQLAAMHTP